MSSFMFNTFHSDGFPVHIYAINIDLLILYLRGHRSKFIFFSSPGPKAQGDKVSYCDRSSSVDYRALSVDFFFKQHLILNHWSKFKIISHECST